MAHVDRFPPSRSLFCTCPSRAGLWGVEVVNWHPDCPGAFLHPRILSAHDLLAIAQEYALAGPDHGREVRS